MIERAETMKSLDVDQKIWTVQWNYKKYEQ